LVLVQSERPIVSVAQRLNWTSTVMQAPSGIVVGVGQSLRHAPLLQTEPLLHCESIVQNGRGRVSTRQTPPSHRCPEPH
jgi:hypothetical protein